MKPITPQKRDGFWVFRRRVPARFAGFDPRGFVRISTHIRVAEDPKGVTAAKIAAQLNRDLEEEWLAKANGGEGVKVRKRYDDAMKVAGAMGFGYLPAIELLAKPLEELGRRIDKLVERRLGGDGESVAALLGGEARPTIMLSKLPDEYADLQAATLSQMSPDQERRWKNQRNRAVEEFIDALGADIPINGLSKANAVVFRKYWQVRITDEEIQIGTANKGIGTVSRMLRKVSEAHELGVPAIFSGLRIEGGDTRQRPPFDRDFIQERILAPGAMDELNEEARRVVYVMVETGLRPSEIVNLTEGTIRLAHKVPHVVIKPEGRVLKTKESQRHIPLVGVALAAMKLQPQGFPRYLDKGTTLSANVNQFFENNGLRQTEEHTLYSLRHSFEDRLTGLKVMPDKIQAYLMGHKYSRPKYGSDPPLPDLQEWLDKIAFLRWPEAL